VHILFKKKSETAEARRPDLILPSLPERVIDNLQRLIESLDEEDAEIFVELISCYQIQKSRMKEAVSRYDGKSSFYDGHIMTEGNFNFTFIKTFELYLRAEKIFPFARKEIDAVPLFTVDRRDVEMLAFKMDIFDDINRQYLNHLIELLPNSFSVTSQEKQTYLARERCHLLNRDNRIDSFQPDGKDIFDGIPTGYRQGIITAITVILGFSLIFLRFWSFEAPGDWTPPSTVAALLLSVSIGLQMYCLWRSVQISDDNKIEYTKTLQWFRLSMITLLFSVSVAAIAFSGMLAF
jgi:hypothetical protein